MSSTVILVEVARFLVVGYSHGPDTVSREDDSGEGCVRRITGLEKEPIQIHAVAP